VQAGAARLLGDRDPDRARTALETIEDVARETVGEIDRLVHVLRERTVIDRASRQPTADRAARERLEQLTPRERDVLALVARGRSNAEIAGELVIEESTVKTHVKHVLNKLGLRDRIQAVIFAYETGVTQSGSGRAES